MSPPGCTRWDVATRQRGLIPCLQAYKVVPDSIAVYELESRKRDSSAHQTKIISCLSLPASSSFGQILA